MTDTNDPTGADDPIDSALGAAGRRLRHQAPDEIASRRALVSVRHRADAPRPPEHRSWWPALIGAGLAAAAVVGVIAIASDDTETLTPATSPDRTAGIESEPTDPPSQLDPTTVPSTTGAEPNGASLVVDGDCITVTTIAGSATGCPLVDSELNHLDQRTFVADLDGPVIVTSGTADPLADLTATVDTGSFASRCRWDDLATRIAEGELVEVVVCNDTGVMAATTGRAEEQDWSVSYFTLPTPYLPDGGELGPGTPIDGLPGALAFTVQPPDASATCSILLVPDRSGWKEACGFVHGIDLATALVLLDPTTPTVHELTVDGTGQIIAGRELEAMAPSSGCSIDSANDLARALPASSIVMGIGCIGDKAALTTGSVLTQQGPPDGSIWVALRENDVWTITDSGTGIETQLSFPIVPFSTWSSWPESTVPGFRSHLWEPIVAIEPQPTVDAFADAVLATLGTLDTDPEFPQNERIIAVQPDGVPLVVAQIDIGGDDSVAGAVIYVWLDEQFDDSGPIGWRAGAVLSGDVCARGESGGRELCI